MSKAKLIFASVLTSALFFATSASANESVAISDIEMAKEGNGAPQPHSNHYHKKQAKRLEKKAENMEKMSEHMEEMSEHMEEKAAEHMEKMYENMEKEHPNW